jgi:hypothetical protein
MSEVVDLDILRPPPKKVVLAGKEIDVSFVPCAITFKVDELVRKIYGFDMEEAQKGGEVTNEVFGLTLELCATFCENQHPDMTLAWFKANTDPAQINSLSTLITETLQRSYSGAEAYQGN